MPLRYNSCGIANTMLAAKLKDRPKCGRCGAPLVFPSSPVEVADSTFTQEVLAHPGEALVFFWATWCAHCRTMFPVLQCLARRNAGIIKVCTINTEKETLLAKGFTVMSVPRSPLYRHGRIIDELNGAVQRPQMAAWIAGSLKTRASGEFFTRSRRLFRVSQDLHPQ